MLARMLAACLLVLASTTLADVIQVDRLRGVSFTRTSACPTGQFHCVNVGHRGVNVPSSRVNDGICDCCDGSDEYSGAISCPNNCNEIGRAAREEAERRAVAQREGFGKRGELVKEAGRLREEKEAQLAAWRKDRETLDPEKDELQMAKSEAEKVEKEAKEAHSAAWKETKEARRLAKAEAAFASLDADGDGVLVPEELVSHSEFDKDGNGEVTLDEAQYYILGKEKVDKATFIEDVWDGLRPVYGGKAAAPPAPPPAGKRLDDAPPVPPTDDTGDEDEHDEVEDFDADKYMAEGAKVDEEDEPEPEYDEATKALVEAADAARAAADEADRKLRELDNSIRDAEDVLKTDFGPEDVFWSLKGTCVEMTESQYTYKFCPFDRTSQRDKSHGGGETNLGVWGEWVGPDDAHYTAMKMVKGTSCWNGPERTTMVHLACGVETRLLSASEPGRCEYEMSVETPAACTDPNAHHAADEL